ncbi:hypothetical protein FNYG_07648 [Fusarium nygamai]|uniref:Uncharacterized protein n=1 Tax=Gibberella nygamai TaxID=42673 RepID=A0A2K0W9Q6_GIBNY|nr:hypothetical protein FNYG_07648 [Fusarium nygamai]
MAITKPQTTIYFFPSQTGDKYLCREIGVYKEGQSLSRTATAGPLILLNGCTYQLTVAHVVDFVDSKKDGGYDTARSTVDDWDDWDDEEDDGASHCSVDEDIASWNISVRRNGTPDTWNDGSTDDYNSEHLSSDSAPKLATQQNNSIITTKQATLDNEEPTNDTVHLSSPPISPPSEQPVFEDFIVTQYHSYYAPEDQSSSVKSCPVSSEMDYLLIPANGDPQALASEHGKAEQVQRSEAFDLQEQTEPRPILIATASLGYIEGLVFPAPSLLRSQGAKEFRTLYCIEWDNAIPTGITGLSGSAVFDKETGLLAGHIVLGCPEKNIWYMLPILSVLHDLEIRFGQRGNCQIQIDVAAAMSLNMIEMEAANFAEPTELSQGFLDGPEIPEDQGSSQHVVSKLPITTNSGRINRPITGILKALRTENAVHLDQWSNRFGQSTHSPESDRRLLASFRNMESAFLETMALMISHPQTTSEDHQMAEIPQARANSLVTTEISETVKTCNHDRKADPQPTAWMVDIFGPWMDTGTALERRDTLALLQGKV